VKLSGNAPKKEIKSPKIVCLATLGVPSATWKFVALSWYNSAAARASRWLYVAAHSWTTPRGAFVRVASFL
jgi:hypothetical protein